MKRIVFFIFLFSSYLVFAAPTTAPPPASIPTHNLLVIQWPKAYCRSIQNLPGRHCVTDYLMRLKDIFTIHGLWPKPDTPCMGKIFSEKDFQILPGLEDKWPNVKGLFHSKAVENKLNKEFWAHEWDYHGRCQTTKLQGAYFQFVLDTFDQTLPIHTEIVKKYYGNNNVVVGDVIQHILTKFHVSVGISCKNRELFEVYFNITLSGTIQNMTSSPCPLRTVSFD